jgi:hypothetical protein
MLHNFMLMDTGLQMNWTTVVLKQLPKLAQKHSAQLTMIVANVGKNKLMAPISRVPSLPVFYFVFGQIQRPFVPELFSMRFAHQHHFVEKKDVSVALSRVLVLVGFNFQDAISLKLSVVGQVCVQGHVYVSNTSLNVQNRVDGFIVSFDFVDIQGDILHGLQGNDEVLSVRVRLWGVFTEVAEQKRILQDPLHGDREDVAESELAVLGFFLTLLDFGFDLFAFG